MFGLNFDCCSCGMNSRIGKILTATAATALAAISLAVSLTACLRGMAPKTDRKSEQMLIEDLNSYSSASHMQRCRYEHFAERASTDGNRTAAGLFSALARSERIHENACIRALSLLKGEHKTAGAAAFEISGTYDNLQRSLDYERSRMEGAQGEAVARAIESRNYYTARILIWIDGTNRRHIELLERCINSSGNGYENCGGCEYDVCPVCGNIYEAECCDFYCPLCRTHRSEFESFGHLQIHQTVANGIDD